MNEAKDQVKAQADNCSPLVRLYCSEYDPFAGVYCSTTLTKPNVVSMFKWDVRNIKQLTIGVVGHGLQNIGEWYSCLVDKLGWAPVGGLSVQGITIGR